MLLDKNVNNILVFRALQLGDMLCAIPAIRALHFAYPGARITLAGLPWTKMLAERFPGYIHDIIPFPGYPGFPEQPFNPLAFPGFLSEVQEQNFDLALQMHGSGIISNPLVALFNAKTTAGFYTRDHYRPNADFFIEYPHHLHEIERHLKLVEALGVNTITSDLEFPITEKDEEDFAKADLPVQKGEYVIIHPGSRGISRQWSQENFAAIADYCYATGLKIVITGTTDEMGLVEKVKGLMQHEPIIAAGKTSLGAVAVLIKNAAALVSNCTGVSHIAAAVKTKSIVISLDGEPHRWGPLNKKLHSTIDWTTTPDLNIVKEEVDRLLFSSINA
jgi:ADP-heptose:LPS heptosyltransferase